MFGDPAESPESHPEASQSWAANVESHPSWYYILPKRGPDEDIQAKLGLHSYP